MNARFADVVVLVAGGTGALGRAVVQGFLAEGALVTTTYRSVDELEQLRAGIGTASARLEGCAVDLSDELATRQAIAAVLARHARIDILVNTVGGYAGGSTTWETEPELLERMLALHVGALHALLRAVVPSMLQVDRGCIVNVAARAALTRPARAAAYAASKAAALAMMGALAAELVGSGIRVNSVLPTTIDTPANRRAMPNADFRRWVPPEQISEVIRFLCSPEGQAVRGAEVVL